MDQLVLLILVGVIGLVNWLIQKSAEARERRKLEHKIDKGETVIPKREEGEPVSRENDPGESMRRLMEALGLPEDAASPPPPLPQRRLPEVIIAPEPPPVLPRKILPEPPPPVVVAQPRATSVHVPKVLGLPAYQWDKKPSPKSVAPAASSRVRTMLASPGSLRDAIILTEILGKPKALS